VSCMWPPLPRYTAYSIFESSQPGGPLHRAVGQILAQAVTERENGVIGLWELYIRIGCYIGLSESSLILSL
jgi:hypothetical protein